MQKLREHAATSYWSTEKSGENRQLLLLVGGWLRWGPSRMIQMRALRLTHLHMDSQVGIRVINHAWETIERSPLESRLRTLLPWEPSSPSEGSPHPYKMADHSDHYWSVYEPVIINLGLLSLPSWPPVSASQAIAYANLCNRLCNFGRLSLPSWVTF